MPDLLLISKDDKTCFELEELSRKIGYRVKSTFDIFMAREWLKTRPFDLALIASGLDIETQQDLAGRLWRLNPLAPLFIYDPEPMDNAADREARLFGADVFRGEKGRLLLEERLEKAFKSDLVRKTFNEQDFGIMVVEDLDSPRDIICMFIESLGYPKVGGWRSAKEAMEELEKNPDLYSCIVTDIKMPEISGKELIEFVRNNPKLQHLPIIVLTAYGTVDTLIDCLKAGATGFLIKPPKKKDLGWELARSLRIMAYQSNPRLASPDDAEAMRDLLVDKGFM